MFEQQNKILQVLHEQSKQTKLQFLFEQPKQRIPILVGATRAKNSNSCVSNQSKDPILVTALKKFKNQKTCLSIHI